MWKGTGSQASSFKSLLSVVSSFSLLSVLFHLWCSYNSVIKYGSECKVCAHGEESPSYFIQ